MGRKHADGVAVGLLLGLANAFVIAIGLSMMLHELSLESVKIVFMICAMPALLVGGVLGWVADATATSAVWVRRLLLVGPALLVVGLLGSVSDLHAIVVSCIPTTAAACWLECATRHDALPPVPIVVVRR
jgi:hypothetical protein